MVKILIVDDEMDVCRFAKAFFEARGFCVSTALGGEEALKLFNEDRPDLVLIDVKMEGMDGVMLLKELKRIDRTVETIMVSAVEDLDVIEEAKRYGATEYITKPLVLEELEKTVLKKTEWIKAQKKT